MIIITIIKILLIEVQYSLFLVIYQLIINIANTHLLDVDRWDPLLSSLSRISLRAHSTFLSASSSSLLIPPQRSSVDSDLKTGSQNSSVPLPANDPLAATAASMKVPPKAATEIPAWHHLLGYLHHGILPCLFMSCSKWRSFRLPTEIPFLNSLVLPFA